MQLLSFLKKAAPQDLKTILLLTILAGFANALLVAIVTRVAQHVAQGSRADIWIGLTFAVAFAVYYLAEKAALLRANSVIERLLKDLRLEIADKIRRSELKTVELLGMGQLYQMVSQETNHLSVVFPVLVESFQQAVLLVASLLYLGYISKAALAVFLLAMAMGVAGYLRLSEGLRVTTMEVGTRQAQMLDAVGDIIHGFKELRLSSRKSDSVYASFLTLSSSAQESNGAFGDSWVSLILITVIVMYGMLGVIGFIFPRYLTGHSLIVFKLTPIILFSVGLVTKLVAVSPMVVKAEIGLQSILEVLRRLDEAGGVTPATAREQAPQLRGFQKISYSGITFSRRDASGQALFTVGPLDLSIDRGELVFLVGGNGSGKSTALRLMTGLYPADKGSILVDGRALRAQELGGFRELFSAILVDFHLFDRLYGLAHVKQDEVDQLLTAVGLAGKVRFMDGRFTDLNLSTGQRKRLALIASLLEDREIYVFDEWSAEQDAHFREHFYTSILPELKAKGKTVIVVTHDERFWHVSDRVIKLDLGTILWERTGAALRAAES